MLVCWRWAALATRRDRPGISLAPAEVLHVPGTLNPSISAANRRYSRRPRSAWRPQAAAWRQKTYAHEAAAFKIDEGPVLVGKVEVRTERPRLKSKGDLFLFADAPHGGRKRLRGCSAANGRFYSRRSRSSWRPQAAAWRQKERGPLGSPLAVIAQSNEE